MKNKTSLISQIISTVLFTVLLIGTMAFFVKVFDASPYKAPVILNRDYDRSAMVAALAPEAVQARYDEILAFGSRAPGQSGLESTAAMIEKAFRDAGLEVITQQVDIPYPLTDGTCGSLAIGSGDSALKLKAWPFKPNYAQPVVTPANGVEGELFLIEENNVRAQKSFKGKIAVIDMAKPLFKQLGTNPGQYKDLGFEAIVLTHADGLEKVPWESVMKTMVIEDLPVNIIRVATDPSVLQHIGEKAVVTAKSRWVNADTRNIFGILRAPGKAESLTIVPFTYDAASVIPDYAEGPVQALQTAIALQVLKGIVPHKDALKRDVVFVAMTGVSQQLYGASRVLSALKNRNSSDGRGAVLEKFIAENADTARMLGEIKKLFADSAFATDPAATDAAIKKLPADVRKVLTDRVSAVARKAVFTQAEVLLQAEITYKRNPDDLTSPAFAAFRQEKQRYDDLNNMSALPLSRALERPVSKTKSFELSDGTPCGLREALESNVDQFIAFHAKKDKTLNNDLLVNKLLTSYKSYIGISPHLQPEAPSDVESQETISYAVGTIGNNGNTGEAANLFYSMLNDSLFALNINDKVQLVKPTTASPYVGILGAIPFDTNPWGVASIPAFSVCTPNNPSLDYRYPFSLPAFKNLGSIKNAMQVIGEATIAAARGYGNFPLLPLSTGYSLQGYTYASGIGNSTVPNYAMANTLICSPDLKPYLFTDLYGKYSASYITMPVTWDDRWYASEAFYFNKEGYVTYVKDCGSAALNIFSRKMSGSGDALSNLILFRATPVAILNTVNPQSMKAFTGLQFLSRSGLAAFPSVCPYDKSKSGMLMDFLPPKEYFFLALKAGAPGNELVATTRAFCLGVLHNDEPHYKPTDNEIDGAGYLAADTEFFPDVTMEAAASMDWLAAKRLNIQTRYGMADDMTLELNENAENILTNNISSKNVAAMTWLGDAEKTAPDAKASLTDGKTVDVPADRTVLERLRNLRQSLSYLILNHPVIRGSVSEAVWGILWYMGLLVPFIFFFEKLVFGFPDIRKQLLAEGITFLIVFALLRILHPAFHMIRSSAMILLGFIIILIVGSVTLVLSGKFQENLDALRRAQGGVKGTGGNKTGIIMTAFMLGLNNMHRRKVRTGLTCATLVLMTFVMICFTSVQSNIVEKETAVGRAAYQGIVVREKQFRPIPKAEIDALNASYAENHTVNVRHSYLGMIEGNGITTLPTFNVVAGEGDKALLRSCKSAIAFSHTEPLRNSIGLLSTNGWFTAEQSHLTAGPYPIIIPDEMAEQLGITPEEVNKAPVPVTVNGHNFYVWNIFKSLDFSNVCDVDGQNLLPFDIEALTNPLMLKKIVLAEDTDPRVQPTDVILALHDQLPITNPLFCRATSAVVDMGSAPYATVRSEINAYLVQTGRDCNYGLDGTAFNGRRARARSMAGLADLLIPLIIAALTVLNTMKGSVYERHNEIFVYNAVGIAPRYIFFMFVAEALVYSVVGAVLGYILSQGTGRILTALNMTGGMNMNFTSVTTIYASLAIAAATLASTYFPAKSAMEIAKPADNAGWSLPQPGADDKITFLLPFTFTHYDRIAVLAFFYKYFENHGEGSSGPFFSGIPVLKLADHTDPLANEAYIPALEVQVWLKPFDLGVSQKITIELGTDPETKEYISKMILERVSGTRDAWLRLNGPLVTLIRRHFLHWRAVPQDQKAELFAEAKLHLEETVLGA